MVLTLQFCRQFWYKTVFACFVTAKSSISRFARAMDMGKALLTIFIHCVVKIQKKKSDAQVLCTKLVIEPRKIFLYQFA